MDAEKLAEQTALVVRGVLQRELSAVEQRWKESFDQVREALTSAIDARHLSEKDDLGELVRKTFEGVDGRLKAVEAKQDELASSIKALPAPKDGTSVTLDDVRPLIEDCLRSISVPKDGVDGKDALEITIHPEMDPRKSYPRGSFVSHLGGLLRSSRKTTPLDERANIDAAGWTVILRGIAEAVVEYPTERTIRNVIRYTDGTETVTEIRSPAVLDRGVFREGTDYEKGDGVTFGGSFWIAQKDAPEGKPGNSSDWRLAVKRGRDGSGSS